MKSVVSLSVAFAESTIGHEGEQREDGHEDTGGRHRDARPALDRDAAALVHDRRPTIAETPAASGDAAEEEPSDEDREEHDVAREQEPLRVDLRADVLRDPEHDPAERASPTASPCRR